MIFETKATREAVTYLSWAADGESVYFTAKVGDNVELFQAGLDGTVTQLTDSPAGTSHYHPTPSWDGHWLLYGSKRRNVRQPYVMDAIGHNEKQLTDLQPGSGAMWPHWQPSKNSATTQ